MTCLKVTLSGAYPSTICRARSDGFPVTDDLLARLSPLQFDHINFLGRYAFFRPQEPGQLPLRAEGDEPSV
ncbi:Tn3 family transposase [Streptomyces sp. NPDC049949]|uniref:Tn3 family transposase n=1 Tax=Streptomyces sp. NPDC049949 TaxID=3154627 RepID=UPI00342ACC8E